MHIQKSKYPFKVKHHYLDHPFALLFPSLRRRGLRGGLINKIAQSKLNISVSENYFFTLTLWIFIITSSLVTLSCQESPDTGKKSSNGMSSPGNRSNLPSEVILIPAGEFIFGDDNPDLSTIPPQLQKVKKWGEDQKPQQKISLKAFYIDKYEVTNEQFQKFKKSYQFDVGKNDHPVSNINWFDAKAYCEWAKKRLPTEEEWEKAARGPDGNLYPWGNKFDKKKANTGFSKLSSTTPVGTFPGDKSFYNVYDMAGNVSEWTSNSYLPYKGSSYKSPSFEKKYKVSRGGSFQDMGHYELEIFSSSTFRYYNYPDDWAGDTGFRCVKDVK